MDGTIQILRSDWYQEREFFSHQCSGEACLFNLPYLCFLYHLFAQKIIPFMKDLPVITLNHQGSFGKNFVKFENKIEMLSTSQARSVSGRNVSSVLSTAWYPRPRAQFSPHGPPAWWITYNYSSVKLSNLTSLNYVLERLKFLKGEIRTFFCSITISQIPPALLK